MDPVVVLRDVVAVAGGFPVLAGAHLTVASGEILLLKGPNGAGKTSLLRLCAGLLPVERGAATVLGVDLLTDRSAVRPLVGLLGHSNGLYHELTVAENVECQTIKVPTGVQDYRPALYGGIAAVELGVEGVRRVALDVDLADHTQPPTMGRHPLPTPVAFATAMSQLGIGDGTPVVAYDDSGGATAGRLVGIDGCD